MAPSSACGKFHFPTNKSKRGKEVPRSLVSLPGRCRTAGGLLFSAAEIEEFNALARECSLPEWNLADFAQA
jgi:hypothetical protein